MAGGAGSGTSGQSGKGGAGSTAGAGPGGSSTAGAAGSTTGGAAGSTAGAAGSATAGAAGASAGGTSAGGSGGSSAGTSSGGSGGTGPTLYTDFPATPVADGDLPPDSPVGGFGDPGSGGAGGPCLVEPQVGTLFPRNWVRPRFRWAATGGDDVFELRITAANQANPLVVYTKATSWTMPLAMWQGLTAHSNDIPLTVTVRSGHLVNGSLDGPPHVGTSGDVTIAPVEAAGSLVYWTTSSNGALRGFSPGDESVVVALEPKQVQAKPQGKDVTCIGCHTSTPDGLFAGFKTIQSASGGVLASVEKDKVGQAPAYWTQTSIDLMNNPGFGIPSFSKTHWATGDRVLLSSWGNGTGANLSWFDLEATSAATARGELARTGDTRGAIMPAWSHDGQSVIYTSMSGSSDGRPASGDNDIYRIPYNDRAGGAATPIAGASDPAYSEYYPALSPDDSLIAFNRTPKDIDPYNQPQAEIFVVPSSGGTPVRLAANDPDACTGLASPGLTNSWPKWAPENPTVGSRTFYWLAFSSRRTGAAPQIYLTAVVVDGSAIKTFPALYIWAQPANEANHTPAWDVFQIPKP